MFDKAKYHTEYVKKNLKRIPLEMPIKDFEEMKAHTEETKETVNGFIKRAINETMERDKS